jgi:hypothetical protein
VSEANAVLRVGWGARVARRARGAYLLLCVFETESALERREGLTTFVR